MYSYFTYNRLDIERMKEASRLIVGEHDFSAFCAAGAQVDNFVRTVYSCEVITEENVLDGLSLTIRVTGNGFLYNMVRIIAGTLLEVGRGAMEPSNITKILESKDRSKAGPTAPACGLTLVEYRVL